MSYTNRNIVINELIGLRARVIGSLDRKQKGISGKVTDETKNTLLLAAQNGDVRVIKASSAFRFYTPDGSFVVDGKEISFRPDERTGKAMKYYKRRKEKQRKG